MTHESDTVSEQEWPEFDDYDDKYIATTSFKDCLEKVKQLEARNAALEQQLKGRSRVEHYCCCGKCNPYPADSIEKQLEIREQQLAASEQRLLEALKNVRQQTADQRIFDAENPRKGRQSGVLAGNQPTIKIIDKALARGG